MKYCITHDRLQKQRGTTLKMLMLICIFFSSVVFNALAQEKIIKGLVVDNNNQAVPGANVVIKGSTQGTVTDLDGKFTIKASDKDILVFSFVGYNNEEVTIGTQTQINVTLKENVKQLNEVVVVGYGVQKKSDLTGAIASVSSESIEKTPVISVDRALQGRAAGVQVLANTGAPGAKLKVNIRGITSINGSQPLYVIDGVAGDINSINPSDIESVEILKDASSSAIYGSQGAAGVVLVTTKKGKEGKLETSFNYYHGWQSPWKKLDLANGPQYGELKNDVTAVLTQSTSNPDFPNYKSLPSYNYQNAVFRNSDMDNYDMGIRGGNEKAKYMLSAGYTKQNGIVHNSDYNRYSVRLNSDYKSSNWLKIGENLSVIKEQYNGLQEWQLKNQYESPITLAIQMQPYIPVYDSTGKWGVSSSVVNPMGKIDTYHHQNDEYKFNSQFYAILEPIKGLTFETRFSPSVDISYDMLFTPVFTINGNASNSQSRISRNTYWTRGYQWQNIATYSNSIVDKFHYLLMAGYEASDYKQVWFQGYRVNLANESPEMWYFDASSDKTNIGQIIQGSGWEETAYSQFYRTNLDWDGIFLFTGNFRRDGSSKFGPLNRFGNFPSISGGIKFSEFDFIKNLNIFSFGKIRAGYGTVGNSPLRDYSYYATVGQVYMMQYAFSNSTSDLSAGAALNAIPSPSIKWETVVESNYGADLAFLDNKLSLTVDYFEKHNQDMIYPVPPLGVQGFLVRDPSQENGGTVPNQIKNIGQLSNRGFEFTLGWKDSKGNFKYSIDLNYTYVTNKAVYLHGDSIATANVPGLGYVCATKEGGEVQEFYGYKTNGLYQQSDLDTAGHVVAYHLADGTPVVLNKKAKPGDVKFVDINKDGKINQKDLVPLGNPYPKNLLGLSMNFEYKNIDLSMFFQGVFGNKIFNAQKVFYYNQDGEFNWSADYYNNRYKLPYYDKKGNLLVAGDNKGTLPRLDPKLDNNNFGVPSDLYIEDGSYLRLKNIQIGYTLPKTWTSKVGIESLRIYVGAQNLLTFTKYTGFDPEVGGQDSPNHDYNVELSWIGIDQGIYPQSRTVTAGINVKF